MDGRTQKGDKSEDSETRMYRKTYKSTSGCKSDTVIRTKNIRFFGSQKRCQDPLLTSHPRNEESRIFGLQKLYTSAHISLISLEK